MTPELLQFGITSLIRIGRAGKTALEQAARDEAVLFPRLQEADFVPLLYVNGYFSRGDARQLVADGGPLKHLWDTTNNQAKETSVGIETLFLASIELEVKIGNDKADPRSTRTDLAAGSLLIKQWDPSREPVTPWITVMLTAADIA
ncbi:MAG: hypothetical protein O7F71_06705, partial [Gammaproteobacteria bacterium]|nr:hypothetical protein [Gammaproteobacteria bacterium]